MRESAGAGLGGVKFVDFKIEIFIRFIEESFTFM